MKRAAAAALVLTLALGSCARRAEVQARAPRTVSAAQVQRRDFILSTEYSAHIVPLLQVSITPKVGGRVSSVAADVGMAVSAGQSLFTLESGDYDAEYRQAAAALGSAKASLTRTSDSALEQQTLQARSASDQAQVAYDQAKSAYDRTKRLYDSGSVPRQQFEEAEARFKAAGIQLDAAHNALSLVQDKGSSQTNEIVSGQVEQARAQADLAKNQLDSTIIRSPIAGRVSFRDVEAGEMVGTSSLAFIVIDESSVYAETGISERVVGGISKGMEMELFVPALAPAPGAGRFIGKVDSVSPAADPRNMLFTVRLLVRNPDGALKGGMLARLKLPIETKRGAILVSERATFSENGGDYVFVVGPAATAGGGDSREGIASMRRVSLGESDGSAVEVLGGLDGSETVITAGQEFLGDGDRVAIAP